MYRLIFITGLFIASLPGFSQETCSLSGTVIDKKTKAPIGDVSVLISDEYRSSVTDVEGYFEFPALAEGQYTVKISHIGFILFTDRITLSPGEHKILSIELTPDIKQLDEVVIEEYKDDEKIISKLPYIQTIVGRDEINSKASRDIGDFLRSSNNINGIRKGGSQIDPVVRGFKFSQLNVQLNGGHKIEGGCPNRMDPATGHIEIEDIESIEVKKGPYSLRYGPVMGAVINMVTQAPPYGDSVPVRVSFIKSYESNWNGNKDHLNLGGGYKWFYYNLSGGRKDYGNYKDGNGNTVYSEFSKYNYKGQLGFIPFKKHNVSFIFEESKGRDVRFPTLPMDERKDDTRLLSADYKANDVSPVVESFRLKLYNSQVRHEMDNKNRPFSDTVVAVSIIHAYNFGGRFETALNLGGGTLSTGMDYESVQKDGDRTKSMIKQPNLPVKREKLWNNAEITNLGFFAEYLLKTGSWELIAATRVDFNEAKSEDISIVHPSLGEIYYYGQDSIRSEFTNFSVSLGSSKRLSDKLTLSLSIGRGVRSPDMTERFIILLPIGYDKFDYLGNPGLKPETNNQADLTLKYMTRGVGKLQINGFYSLVNDYIAGKRIPPSVQKPLSKDVLGVRQFYNAGNARLTGFELSYATPQQHKLYGSVFASWTYGTIDEIQQYVMNEQGEVTDDLVVQNDAMSEIPPFEATANLLYRMFRNKLIAGITTRFVSAQNHVSRAFYEQPSEGFILTGLSLDYAFNRYLKITAGVNNLFDVAYYEHLNRNIIGSNVNLYEPGRSFYINFFVNL